MASDYLIGIMQWSKDTSIRLSEAVNQRRTDNTMVKRYQSDNQKL
jgi:hypothetical protein